MPDFEGADYITITIGSAGNLTTENLAKAVMVTLQAIASPIPAVSICLGGYDDDPREIFEIEEARLFIMKFAAVMFKLGVPLERFFPDTQNLFRLCLAAEEGDPIEIVDDHFDVNAALREHKEKIKTKVN